MNRREAYELALEVAAAGIPVLPVNLQKQPLVRGRDKQGNAGGVHLASTDPNKLRDMFKPSMPGECLVAAHPGPAGYMVLDVDKPKWNEERQAWSANGFATLRRFLANEGADLTTAAIARTGSGGCHLWFRKPLGDEGPIGVGSKNGWLPGIDLKADGGYVVVPGSHYTTDKGELRKYAWVDEIDWPVEDGIDDVE